MEAAAAVVAVAMAAVTRVAMEEIIWAEVAAWVAEVAAAVVDDTKVNLRQANPTTHYVANSFDHGEYLYFLFIYT